MMIKMTSSLVLAALLIFSADSMACGPDFDEAYFVRADKNKMYVIPTGDFIYELKAMLGKDIDFLQHDSEKAALSSIEADVKSLEEVLKGGSLSQWDQKKAVDSYLKARQQVLEYVRINYPDDSTCWYGNQFRSHERIKEAAPKVNWMALDKNIPREFLVYIEGARHYAQNNFSEAMKSWKALLNLPRQERVNKSVWAAFMLGKAALNTKSKESVQFFEMARKLAQEGNKDPLNLAFDSYGWQALAELEFKQYADSIKHYLAAKDAASLVFVCGKISEEGSAALKDLVQDAVARKVLLAWAVSRETYSAYANDWDPGEDLQKFFSKYLTALENLKDDPVAEADKVAWLYYNVGDFKNARRWVDLTKMGTPLAKLIDARLVLRSGDTEGALTRLRDVIPAFEKSRDRDMFYSEDIVADVHSQVAVLKMSRKEYLAAFETLLQGKYWEDIAYVAEKVLTADELAAYLDSHKGDTLLQVPQDFHTGYFLAMKRRVERHPEEMEYYRDELNKKGRISTGAALSYLLARRYVRAAQWDKALQYYPRKQAIWRYLMQKGVDGVNNYEMVYEDIDPGKKMVELRDHLARANDTKSALKVRAKAFYEAGIVMRKYGMEIMGTELDPDSFVTAGQFPEYESMGQRFAMVHEEEIEEAKTSDWGKEAIEKTQKRRADLLKSRDFFSGTLDEEKRALASLPDPHRRWHYRYKAAELMWKAAELLPDNDDLKAKALCLGGTYLKIRDKKRANKFYKELVKTCGNTTLGKQANKIRWFPKMEE